MDAAPGVGLADAQQARSPGAGVTLARVAGAVAVAGAEVARSLAVHTAPVAELFSIYVVMAVVLMFRPEGLFQRIQARKI